MFDRTNIHWPLEVVVRPVGGIVSNGLEPLITKLATKHPLFMAQLDRVEEAVLIGGCDERQLENNLNLPLSNLSCDVQADAPHVGYRETISKENVAIYNHWRQTGDNRQFASVKIVLKPSEDNSRSDFENKVVSDAVPEQYIAGVERGILAALSEGVLTGFPMVGVKVSLLVCGFHEEYSSAIAFEIASRAAFRAAIENAVPVLVEPIIRVEVKTPEDSKDAIGNDLINRFASPFWIERDDEGPTIIAFVPAAQMFGFSRVCADLTRGHGSFSTQFAYYETERSKPDGDPLWPEPAAAALRA